MSRSASSPRLRNSSGGRGEHTSTERRERQAKRNKSTAHLDKRSLSTWTTMTDFGYFTTGGWIRRSVIQPRTIKEPPHLLIWSYHRCNFLIGCCRKEEEEKKKKEDSVQNTHMNTAALRSWVTLLKGSSTVLQKHLGALPTCTFHELEPEPSSPQPNPLHVPKVNWTVERRWKTSDQRGFFSSSEVTLH